MSLHNMTFNGLSGINSMAGNMAVLGDNVANVNTVAFKGAQASFQSVLNSSNDRFSVGHGSEVQAVSKNFRPGVLESTTRTTDLAIAGKGFFMLHEVGQEEPLYTRDGQFQLKPLEDAPAASMYLVNAANQRVQGSNLGGLNNGGEAIGDILVQRQSLPQATNEISLALNLENRPPLAAEDYTSLHSAWDGADKPSLADGFHDYNTKLTSYDDRGEPFDLDIFFGQTDQRNQREFLVTMDPEQDRRLLDGEGSRYNAGEQPEKGAGALLYGKLNFGDTGELRGVQTWGVLPDGSLAAEEDPPGDLLSFNYNLWGEGDDLSARLDFGAPAPGEGGESALSPIRTTSYATQSTTIHQQQNGFGAGTLENISVKDGVIVGHYSNGRSQDQARLMLADFRNYRGLDPVGGNAYKATAAAGERMVGAAGSGALGQVRGNTLEGSNVDLGRQFVDLIMTQRGFQANSKSITTADEIHQNLMRLK